MLTSAASTVGRMGVGRLLAVLWAHAAAAGSSLRAWSAALLVLAVVLFGSHAHAEAARIADVFGAGVAELADGSVSIVVDASAPASVVATALVAPDRLILDMPGTRFVGAAHSGPGRGFVRAVTFGGADADGAFRLVLDLDQTALAESIAVVPDAGGARIVVHLARVDAPTFAAAARESVDPDVTVTATVPREDAPDGPSATVTAPVVTIDPGHGGIDPGAVGPNGAREKDIALSFSLRLRDALRARGYTVVMTRETDVFVRLERRVEIAREAGSALLLSIHADTLTDEPGVRGATFYTLSDRASDRRSQLLAEKENAVDGEGGVAAMAVDESVAAILFDLARRETRLLSVAAARKLVDALGSTVAINKNPKRSARFQVLTAPDVPSILFELGYLSSAEDAALIVTPEWQGKAAAATAEAVGAFLAARSALVRP
jgi:N-acetylmuramoyl-L-alanine amidase